MPQGHADVSNHAAMRRYHEEMLNEYNVSNENGNKVVLMACLFICIFN